MVAYFPTPIEQSQRCNSRYKNEYLNLVKKLTVSLLWYVAGLSNSLFLFLFARIEL